MSGVERLIQADTKGIVVPTNEMLKEEGRENPGNAEERAEAKK